MKKILLLSLTLMITGLAHAGPQPDFSFTDLEGNSYTDESLKGTAVVVYVGSHL